MSSADTMTTTAATGATGRSGERSDQNAAAYRICAVRKAAVPAKNARSPRTTSKPSPTIENTMPNATSFSTTSVGGEPTTRSSDAVAIGFANAMSANRFVSAPMMASAPNTATSTIPKSADETIEPKVAIRTSPRLLEILTGRRQHLARLGAVGRPHDALSFHVLDETCRSIVADLQAALDVGHGRLSRLAHDRDGLVV